MAAEKTAGGQIRMRTCAGATIRAAVILALFFPGLALEAARAPDIEARANYQALLKAKQQRDSAIDRVAIEVVRTTVDSFVAGSGCTIGQRWSVQARALDTLNENSTLNAGDAIRFSYERESYVQGRVCPPGYVFKDTIPAIRPAQQGVVYLRCTNGKDACELAAGDFSFMGEAEFAARLRVARLEYKKYD